MDADASANALKDAGNQAMKQQNYLLALTKYTAAIQKSETENHLIYANRAQAHLKLDHIQGCINDCNRAIKIEPTFVKSYFRKATALACKVGEGEEHEKAKQEAEKTLLEGLQYEPRNKELILLKETIESLE